jgi:beta-lactamase class A
MVRLYVPKIRQVGRWFSAHRRQLLLYGGGGLIALLVAVQLIYPSDRLLPFARIDGQQLSMVAKKDAISQLNASYAAHTVSIYLGNDARPVTSPSLSTMKLTVDNTTRVNGMDYPWYVRLVPSSLFWYQLSAPSAPKPTYGNGFDTYVEQKLMPDCKVAATNATLKVTDGTLKVVSAKAGNECNKDDVVKTLKSITPRIDTVTSVRVSATKLAAKVTDAMAQGKADELNGRLKAGVDVTVDGQVVARATTAEVLAWLDISSPDDTVVVSVNTERAQTWLNVQVTPKVAIAAGTSHITTYDFTETSRTNGATGRALDLPQTVASIQAVVSGQASQATAVTKTISPAEVYTRSYSASDTGFSALLANYAHDHSGTFGVSFIELDGKKRHADYQGDKAFVTASTYKLFAAYELLKQIDAGKRSWDAESTCFNKMISRSDNACAEAYLDSLGLSTITKDIQAIGLKNSTFMKSGGPFTTANDLTLLLGMLQSQQNFSATNRDRLISAMKANIYRQGIPAGVNGTVADKVGFLDGLLHDAAIVYSPSGTYVLAIMTDGSSWATIADLAKQVDTLHSQ